MTTITTTTTTITTTSSTTTTITIPITLLDVQFKVIGFHILKQITWPKEGNALFLLVLYPP